MLDKNMIMALQHKEVREFFQLKEGEILRPSMIVKPEEQPLWEILEMCLPHKRYYASKNTINTKDKRC
jgi:hypothetical protein